MNTSRAASTVLLAIVTLGAVGSAPAVAKDMIDYFQPMPIHDKLTSSTWGASGVIPRDISNGLEDPTLKQWCYWDGKILKAPDGKFHLFGSRWTQTQAHNDAWMGSVAIHATSDNVMGPFVDLGLAYTNQSGAGHNVQVIQMPDGRYAMLLSETRPGDVFFANSLDGPWTLQGSIKIDNNGFSVTQITSNLSILVRPDGSYLMVSRHGNILLSTTGIMGTYKVQGNSVYPSLSGLNNANAEDPVIWYSGGVYHMTVNWWDARKAHHLQSPDGIRNWKENGLAYDPTRNFLRYTDGTINHWNKIERPNVYIENGHVTHFTFAVVDVPKEQELGNDNHGDKIIVVPFDGVTFDADTGVAGSAGGTGGRAGTGGVGGGGVGGRGTGGSASGGIAGSGGANGTGGGSNGSGGSTSSGGNGPSDGGATGGTGAGTGGADNSGTGGGSTSASGGNGTIATGGVSGGTGGAFVSGSGTGGFIAASGGHGGASAVNTDGIAAGCACTIPGSERGRMTGIVSSVWSILSTLGALGVVLPRGRRRRARRANSP